MQAHWEPSICAKFHLERSRKFVHLKALQMECSTTTESASCTIGRDELAKAGSIGKVWPVTSMSKLRYQ